MGRHLLSALFLTPLAGAVALFAMKRSSDSAAKCGTAAFAIAAFVLSALLWSRYDPAGPTWQFTERIDLLSTQSVTVAIGVDGFGISLVTLTTLIVVVALAASWKDIEQRASSTLALMLLLEAMVLGVFVTTNLLLYVVLSIAAMLTMTVLVASWSGRDRRSVTRVSLHMAVASITLIIGVIVLAFQARAMSGVMTFDMVRLLELTIPVERQRLVFVSLFACFAIQLAMFPLQTWLTAAVERAPIGGALFLVPAMLKLGIYGLMRISLPLLPDATRAYAPVMAGLAVVTIVASLAMAVRQRNWRAVAAYSSAAAIAASLIAMLRLTPTGVMASILQQSDQAVVLAGLLLAIGLTDRPGSQSGRLQNPRLILAFLVLLIAVSSIWTAAASQTTHPLVHPLVETSVGRVVARINPAYAPLVKQPSDCGSPAAPVLPSAGSSASWVITQPCSEPGQSPKPTEHK